MRKANHEKNEYQTTGSAEERKSQTKQISTTYADILRKTGNSRNADERLKNCEKL
jgi:hypothetical protein